MAFALLFAMALALEQPASSTDPSSAPQSASSPADSSAAAGGPPGDGQHLTREQMEDVIPAGAPTSDYEFVAWCHGALAGQIELDPIIEKDMDAIEGKAKAAERRAGDEEIAKEHKRYLALYEKALTAAEKASPVALHEKGVDAELQGYRIWGATRNKEPIWRMVDWGNWEVPPSCEKIANRLYDRASLLGAALTPEETPGSAAKTAPEAGAAPPPPAGTASSQPNKAQSDGMRGPL